MVGLGCEPSTDDEDTVECRYHISSSGNILVMVDELKVIWRCIPVALSDFKEIDGERWTDGVVHLDRKDAYKLGGKKS